MENEMCFNQPMQYPNTNENIGNKNGDLHPRRIIRKPRCVFMQYTHQSHSKKMKFVLDYDF